jgi:hypothetical protein
MQPFAKSKAPPVILILILSAIAAVLFWLFVLAPLCKASLKAVGSGMEWECGI